MAQSFSFGFNDEDIENDNDNEEIEHIEDQDTLIDPVVEERKLLAPRLHTLAGIVGDIILYLCH